MMPSANIELFAKMLIEAVRDPAVRSADMNADPRVKAFPAQRWRDAMALGADAAVQEAVPDAVDEAIFHLLSAIDQGVLKLRWTTPDGDEIDLTDEGLGELAGWFVGLEAWRGRYCQERFFEFIDPQEV